MARMSTEYYSLHAWVQRQLGSPKLCEHCGTTDPSINFQWANKSKEYLRDLTDWIRLCVRCHHKYDDIHRRAWDTRGRTRVKVSCSHCEKNFLSSPSRQKVGRGKYCSRSCMYAARTYRKANGLAKLGRKRETQRGRWLPSGV